MLDLWATLSLMEGCLSGQKQPPAGRQSVLVREFSTIKKKHYALFGTVSRSYLTRFDFDLRMSTLSVNLPTLYLCMHTNRSCFLSPISICRP